MKHVTPFLRGLGAGAALVSLMGAAALWKSGLVSGHASGETEETRARRNCQRAEKLARLSPNYVDACRAAGL